jgi:hypothetical protein
MLNSIESSSLNNFWQYWGLNSGFVVFRQVLYGLSHVLAPFLEILFAPAGLDRDSLILNFLLSLG